MVYDNFLYGFSLLLTYTNDIILRFTITSLKKKSLAPSIQLRSIHKFLKKRASILLSPAANAQEVICAVCKVDIPYWAPPRMGVYANFYDRELSTKGRLYAGHFFKLGKIAGPCLAQTCSRGFTVLSTLITDAKIPEKPVLNQSSSVSKEIINFITDLQ